MVTLQEFVKRTGSEIVAGLIVIGEREERRVLGYLHDGTYQLNAEGHEILRSFESGGPKPVKGKPFRRKTSEPDVGEIEDIDLDV